MVASVSTNPNPLILYSSKPDFAVHSVHCADRELLLCCTADNYTATAQNNRRPHDVRPIDACTHTAPAYLTLTLTLTLIGWMPVRTLPQHSF